jgi:hypothetical protein
VKCLLGNSELPYHNRLGGLHTSTRSDFNSTSNGHELVNGKPGNNISGMDGLCWTLWDEFALRGISKCLELAETTHCNGKARLHSRRTAVCSSVGMSSCNQRNRSDHVENWSDSEI